ncbi:protein of unknown function [Streptomyces sp. KY70]|nr:protein of unknown function [Streptomyces sp. KY70]
MGFGFPDGGRIRRSIRIERDRRRKAPDRTSPEFQMTFLRKIELRNSRPRPFRHGVNFLGTEGNRAFRFHIRTPGRDAHHFARRWPK